MWASRVGFQSKRVVLVTGELVLITGGAGFIGSHTADRLLEIGYRVRTIDSLIGQVHGDARGRPDYLDAHVELHRGDIRDASAVERALQDATYVYHFAAETSVGQSMHAVEQYLSTNVLGTAQLWEAVQERPGQIKRIVLASSRAIYGEGRYYCFRCGHVFPEQRSEDQLLAGNWWHYCPVCGARLEARATDETSPPNPVSVYGLTKRMQEDVCRLMRRTLGVPVTVLRYFNVYGPRQSLTNPYTGLIPMFCTRIKNGRPLVLYEEGVPLRDFVHIDDVVDANVAALDGPGEYEVVNVGSGQAMSLTEVADTLCSVLDLPCRVALTKRFRVGDVLGCYANLDGSARLVGTEQRIDFKTGVKTLLPWLDTESVEDRSEEVEAELRHKGVLRDGNG
jgi:dTDP-L-rhamnose 4-epimerase